MRRKPTQILRRFLYREDGSVTMIEFVFMIPLVFTAFLMSMEMGIYSIRQTFLDRGLDITVRHIRLSTGADLKHDDLKDMICEQSIFLPQCKEALKLEMKPLDPRNFAAFDEAADCVDLSEDIEPEDGLNLGKDHELMVLRACYTFEPVFASTGLGKRMDKDGAGRVRMLSYAAFVQEPG